METFCDELRCERERLGVSIETISDLTKVPGRHLLALEAGDFSELPGGIFRKGILRGYLSALDIEPSPWIERFEALLREREAPDPLDSGLSQFAETIHRSRPEPVSPRLAGRWLGVVGMAVLLVAFGWCVWRFVLRGHVVISASLSRPPAPFLLRYSPSVKLSLTSPRGRN